MTDRAIDQNIQDLFVLLCIIDTKFLKTTRMSILPEYFGSTVSEWCVRLCYDFYDQYRMAPDNHFYDEVVAKLKDEEPERKELTLVYIDKVSQLPTPSHTYVLSRISAFIQAREFQKAALDFAKLAEEGDFDTARERMTAALRTGASFDQPPLNYFKQQFPTWAEDDDDESQLITLGIPVFGDSVMLKRKQLVTILSSAKGGKTWFLCWLAKQALKKRLKVLYLSHELSEKEVEKRFDMIFTGLVSREHYSNVELKTYNEVGQITNVERRHVGVLADNTDQVRHIRRRMARYGGSLMIKQYPMYTCTIGEMERLIDHLEVFENFIPDVIINDYPTIMKLPRPNDDLRHQLNHAYMHHKRIADERNMLVITAAQTNKQGFEKVHISKKDVAEDVRILANTDMIIALGQSREMEPLQQMQVTVLAARDEQDGISCRIATNYAIGQVVMDSWIPEED